MQHNIFSPRFRSLTADALSAFFVRGAQVVFTIVMGILPVWFIPELAVSFGFTKSILVVVGVYLTGILATLAVLRSGKITISVPWTLVFFWLFAVSTVVSALLSGDTYDSLYGASFDIQSAGFTVVLALLMSTVLVFTKAKAAVVRLLLLLGLSVFVVYVFSIARIIFGQDFLSFGVFTSPTITLVGSLNDLALYAGLVLISLLVLVHKIPNNLIARGGTLLLALLSLGILAVVNFSFVWICVGFLSLLTFLYLVARDTWLQSASAEEMVPVSRFTLALVALICVVAGAFVVSGDYLGTKVSNVTGITYLEVRPSFEATTDIAKQVYSTNALTGVGANRFEDAWRMYKSGVINNTQFWGTSFSSGNSFVYTILITTGLMGGVFFIIFIGFFIYTGYRLLFSQTTVADEGWGTIGTMVFVAAAYLWMMTFWYTPGTTIMYLTALFTGLTLVVVRSRSAAQLKTIDVATSKQHGILLIAGSLIFIVATTVGLIVVNKQFYAQAALAQELTSLANSFDLARYDTALATASVRLPHHDAYPAERARIRLAELNRLLTLTEPTTDDQRSFEQSLVEGVRLSEEAILIDSTSPYNYALLGSFYGLLNPSEYEGVAERRTAAFVEARRFDPKNPEYALIEAQVARRFGEVELARTRVGEALALKGNYTEALFTLSQLEIDAGNATSAIAATESIITLEPYNPGRRYQLGLLKYAIGELSAAAASFEAALILDGNYANARYMLALVYLDLGRTEEALSALKRVAETNPENTALTDLISQIESGSFVNPGAAAEPVPEAESVTAEGETVTTTAPDTDLVSPVNGVPEPATETESQPEPAPESE